TARRILPRASAGRRTPRGVRGASPGGPLVVTSVSERGKSAGTVAAARTFPRMNTGQRHPTRGEKPWRGPLRGSGRRDQEELMSNPVLNNSAVFDEPKNRRGGAVTQAGPAYGTPPPQGQGPAYGTPPQGAQWGAYGAQAADAATLNQMYDAQIGRAHV